MRSASTTSRSTSTFADSDPGKNLAAEIRINIGSVDDGFAPADRIFEAEYIVPKVQQAHIEPHVVVTYWDEDDRLVIRTSTQVPFHVRRILSPVLGLSAKRIRVIKPRIGGGFGGKQEVLIEDVAAHLTIATGRPVRFEYTRGEEFYASRSRHPMRIKMKTGVTKEGKITANSMYALSDTGGVWLPCAHRHRQHRPQSDGAVHRPAHRRQSAHSQHSFLCRHRVHQHSARGRVPG